MLSTLFVLIVISCGAALVYAGLNLWYAYVEGFILDYGGIRREPGSQGFNFARQYNWAIAGAALLVLLATLYFSWRSGIPPA